MWRDCSVYLAGSRRAGVPLAVAVNQQHEIQSERARDAWVGVQIQEAIELIRSAAGAGELTPEQAALLHDSTWWVPRAPEVMSEHGEPPF